MTPHAADDLNRFMEKLPQNAGNGPLVAAGISWVMVAALGLFTMMQLQHLTELRAELLQSEALKPVLPVISQTPVPVNELKVVTDGFKAVYPGMNINVSAGSVTIQSKSTTDYANFREILGHIVNAGPGWVIQVESLCVGRECKLNALNAKLKIQKLKIDKPSSSSTM